jgi:pyruvate formate lyase activating enzyme
MSQGTLFDIQHFGVHDGPGIRTLVFMKGCPLRCSWCCNPESHSGMPQVRYIRFRCKACHRCAEACTQGAITPINDSVLIDYENCRACTSRTCLDVCYHEALNLTGYSLDPKELLAIVLKDLAFYRNSGGGVTFTGGEPLSQPDFLLESLRLCKEAGIHTAIETCGYGRRSDLEKIAPYTDLFLFDIKIINPDIHLRHTGQSNDIIIRNLDYLAKEHKHIILRFPLIPGITDTEENIGEIIGLMKKLNLEEIQLEPYHTLGESKYEEFGIEKNQPGLVENYNFPIDVLKQQFRNHGIICELA